MSLLTPADLGAPAAFSSWRARQDWALEQTLASHKRFVVNALPTGVGKSLIGICRALAWHDPSVFLAATKGHQQQYLAGFASIGLYDVRGMSNYRCRALPYGNCDEGPCLDGMHCRFMETGCEYFDRLRAAVTRPLVLTNYAMWFALRRSERSVGERKLLVLDEAHDVPDILAAAVGARFSGEEVEFPADASDATESLASWQAWAARKLQDTNLLLASAFLEATQKRELRDLKRRLETVAGAAGDWVIERSEREEGWSFEPLWPAAYAEPWLFRGIPSVVMLSATITPKALQYLGLKPEDYHYIETASPFPAGRRPIIHYCSEPGVRVTGKMSEWELGNWATRIDQVIRGRQDRKGIIHTVSYARAREILKRSEFARYMVTHTSGRLTQRTVDEFKRAPAPAILVSPSVHTGYDFPGLECEYQIVAKVPFPDTRTGAAAARQKADPEWSAYRAATVLVQMCGRGMRSEQDRCETIVVDDTFRWVRSRYKSFFPRWFHDACRVAKVLPTPLPKL